MTQFILHLGPAKTGTRYLQEAFAAARPLLADRGILYPPIWGEHAHDELAEGLRRIPDPPTEKLFEELHESGYPTVLLSAKGLSDLPAGSVEYLRILTGRRNPVRIIYYVRSWAELLAAHWKQRVLDGSTETLHEYLFAFANDPADSPVVNFAPCLRRYAAQFARHAIDIVSYDSVAAGSDGLFRHFAAKFLNWPDAPVPDLAPPNVSPDAGKIEVVRALHAIARLQHGHSPSRERSRAMAERYLRDAAGFDAPALHRVLALYERRLSLDELDLHLAHLHRELFNEFRDMLIEPRTVGAFFQAKRVEVPYIARDALLGHGVAAELRMIYARVQAALAESSEEREHVDA